MSDSEAKVRADAKFKRREEQIRQGAEAWAQYEAATRDIAEKSKASAGIAARKRGGPS